jgi:hypothetical protein
MEKMELEKQENKKKRNEEVKKQVFRMLIIFLTYK